MAAKNIIRENEETYQQYKVWALVTQVSIHRLAWLLNHEFDWSLVRVGDVVLREKSSILLKNEDQLLESEQSLAFPIQSYDSKSDRFQIDLMNNKNGSIVFLPELKQFDYLFIVHGEFDYLPSNMLERMNQFAPVQIAVNIDKKKIKNKSLLLSYR